MLPPEQRHIFDGVASGTKTYIFDVASVTILAIVYYRYGVQPYTINQSILTFWKI